MHVCCALSFSFIATQFMVMSVVVGTIILLWLTCGASVMAGRGFNDRDDIAIDNINRAVVREREILQRARDHDCRIETDRESVDGAYEYCARERDLVNVRI